MSAKEEIVCSFQEIVLAHCGFKPRIAASLSWSYTATSVQTKHRRTSQRLRLVRCRKWSGNLTPRASMFAPARKGRISCAVKSNAKNLRGLGKERRLIFLWLVLFSRRGTGYEILTSSVYVFTTESHLPLAGHAPHVSCSFLKLFQSTEPNLISGRRQKRGWANGCHSIFCKKLVSLCLSAQERLITTRINIRVRIWVLQWEGRKKRKPPRTPVKSFINFLVLTVSKKGVVAAI